MTAAAAIIDNATCQRCAISAWHPEARTCTAADCELRGGATREAAGAGLEDHFEGVSPREARDHVS